MILKVKTITISICAVLLVAASALAQQPTVQARSVQPTALSGDLIDVMRANDNQVNTRATSGKADYSGMSVTLDLGGEQNVIGVHQDHGRWPLHYAGAYRVEVAASTGGPWFKTFEGPGKRGDSKALFEAVRARFIRVTATATGGGAEDWSIAELRGYIDPGARARAIPAPATGDRDIAVGEPRPDRPGRELRNSALATDRKNDTRAASETANYTGMSLTFDLGGEFELSRVVQNHGQWPEDFPREYKVEVSRQRDEGKFREVWRGRGERGRSVARFPEVTTRYVRITALGNRDREHWWSIAELRTNRDPDVVERDEDDSRLDRDIRNVTAQGFTDPRAAIDDNEMTRATTRTTTYAGSWIQADLGGSYTVSRVTQFHEPNERDFPGRFLIEVSQDGSRWQKVWEGEGERSRTGSTFAPVRTRYVRITALNNRNNQNWWSIHTLKIKG